MFNTTTAGNRARRVNHGSERDLLAGAVRKRKQVCPRSAVISHAATLPLLAGGVVQADRIIASSALNRQLTHSRAETIEGFCLQLAAQNPHGIITTQHVERHTAECARSARWAGESPQPIKNLCCVRVTDSHHRRLKGSRRFKIHIKRIISADLSPRIGAKQNQRIRVTQRPIVIDDNQIGIVQKGNRRDHAAIHSIRHAHFAIVRPGWPNCDLFRNDATAKNVNSMIDTDGCVHNQQVSRISVDTVWAAFIEDCLYAPAARRILPGASGIVCKRRNVQRVDIQGRQSDRNISGIWVRIIPILPGQVISVNIQLLNPVNQDWRTLIDSNQHLLNAGVDGTIRVHIQSDDSKAIGLINQRIVLVANQIDSPIAREQTRALNGCGDNSKGIVSGENGNIRQGQLITPQTEGGGRRRDQLITSRKSIHVDRPVDGLISIDTDIKQWVWKRCKVVRDARRSRQRLVATVHNQPGTSPRWRSVQQRAWNHSDRYKWPGKYVSRLHLIDCRSHQPHVKVQCRGAVHGDGIKSIADTGSRHKDSKAHAKVENIKAGCKGYCIR